MSKVDKLIRKVRKTTDLTRKRFGTMRDLIELRRALEKFEESAAKRGKR